MKSALKGSLFSLALMLVIFSIAAFINMKLNIPRSFMKGLLWTASGACILSGVLPVTKSGTERRFLKGLGSAFFTVLFILIVSTATSGHIPASGAFYAYVLICMLCGVLGAIIGINI